MKKILLITYVFMTCAIIGHSQNRYLDEVFDDVNITIDQTYGANVDVLAQALIELKTDIYMPAGDTETNRPVVVLAHTGSFIPRVVNQSATGFKDDSVVVEVATRLAKRGYVVFPFTYRQGWLPQSVDDNVRKGSLLQAAYRGIQDIRTLVRYVRLTADNGNPFGIDPDRIVAWGIGTGGYLSFGAATLDEYEEVVLPKFINTANALPFIDTTQLGNLYGTSFGVLGGDTVAVPNHVGYSSDIQMAVNMGGALGDESWIDGDAQSNEPPMVGFHCPTDAFAPYFQGPVIVPGPNFVVLDQASGTRQAVGLANSNDINASIIVLDNMNDPLGAVIDFYSTVDVTIGGQTIKLGTDNFYPFTGLTPGAGSPWDWWDYNVLAARVAGVNAALGTDYNADTIHQSGLLTNPDMSGDKAKRYLDTIMMVTTPRMCLALGLDCGFSAVNQIEAIEVDLVVQPNPATTRWTFTSAVDAKMKRMTIYNSSGTRIDQVNEIQSNQYEYATNGMANGVYYAMIEFDDGVVVQKLSVMQ